MGELLRRISSSEVTEWAVLFRLEAEQLDRASKQEEDEGEAEPQVMGR